LSYDKMCENLCPDYMAMGMTWDDYWNGDPQMTVAFRKMHRLKQESRNQEMWLQGMYIYEALLDVSPMFHDLVKEPKPIPYPAKPYPISKTDSEKRKEQEQIENDKKIQAGVRAWKERANRVITEREKKGAQTNG